MALESVYVGLHGGHVGLLSNTTYANGLGFGGDVSFRTNPMLMLALRGQFSSHSPTLSLFAGTVSADVLVGNIYDIEIFLGGGPGLYSFSRGTSDMKFGLHGELFGDLIVGSGLRVGLGTRFHGIFSPAADESGFYTIMMRLGYTFEM